jgi:hypothetical protein
MAHTATCAHCGLTSPVAGNLGPELLTCPRCGGEVAQFDTYGPTFQMSAGSIAASVAAIVMVAPCACLLLGMAVATLHRSLKFAVLMGGVVAGAILWRAARNTTKRLLSPGWALLASSALAILLVASLLLIAIATELAPW